MLRTSCLEFTTENCSLPQSECDNLSFSFYSANEYGRVGLCVADLTVAPMVITAFLANDEKNLAVISQHGCYGNKQLDEWHIKQLVTTQTRLQRYV